jgi:CubicO group peptidase (beta-lactamase class C family)
MPLGSPEAAPAHAAAAITSTEIDCSVAGVRSVRDGIPVTEADRFHLGSNTKAMTATLAAIVVERNALRWTSDAADVLGTGPVRGLTLERLLAHAAGVRALTEDEELVGLPDDRRALAEVLLYEEPLFEPGSDAAYSNGGYAIVSAMLEKTLDVDFEDALQQELFEPLGLEAGFGWPDGLPGHYCRDDMLVPHDPGDGYALPSTLTAAGDVNATIESYARFVQLHLRGLRGDPHLLRSSTYSKLHTPLLGPFALGWGIQEWEGAGTSVHAGSAETFFAIVAVQPARDFAAAAVVNAGGERAQQEAVEIVRELVRERSTERAG